MKLGFSKIFAALFALALSSASHAATVLSVSGNTDAGEIMSTEGISGNQGVGVTFDLLSDVTNAGFELTFACYTVSGCSGLIQWTDTGLGPGSLNQDAAFFSTGFGITTLTAFTGLNLAAGTWSVLVSLDNEIQTGVWVGPLGAPVIDGDGRADLGSTQIIDGFNQPNPVQSTFLNSNNLVSFTLTADAAPEVVPLPASLFPLMIGIFALGRFRKRS